MCWALSNIVGPLDGAAALHAFRSAGVDVLDSVTVNFSWAQLLLQSCIASRRPARFVPLLQI